MSRVGKHAIDIPANVKVTFENGLLSGNSTLGSFTYAVPDIVNVKLENGKIEFSIDNKEDKEARAMWGTCRASVANAVAGLVKHFEVKADLVGVGYRYQWGADGRDTYVGIIGLCLYDGTVDGCCQKGVALRLA